MTTTDAEVYVVARLRDGSATYLRARERRDSPYTPHKRLAVRLTPAEADETIARLHGVQASGVYWQDVAYFGTSPAKPRRPA